MISSTVKGLMVITNIAAAVLAYMFNNVRKLWSPNIYLCEVYPIIVVSDMRT